MQPFAPSSACLYALPTRRSRVRVHARATGGAGLLGDGFHHEHHAHDREVSNAGSINTFDVTPDGQRIVFDRVEERSNLVLIERPQ